MMLSLPLPTILRPLAAGTFVSPLGNGAWYASWALFLTRAVELSVAQAGVALTIAGVAGIAAAAPVGRLADRLGPREVTVVLSVVRAAVMGGFLFADGLLGVTLAASLMAAAQHGASGARTALSAGLTPPGERLDALASLRVLGHAGDAIGAAAGALVIQLDAGAAYAAVTLPAPAITRRALGMARATPFA